MEYECEYVESRCTKGSLIALQVERTAITAVLRCSFTRWKQMALARKMYRDTMLEEAFLAWRVVLKKAYAVKDASHALADRQKWRRASEAFAAWRDHSHRSCWLRQAVRLAPAYPWIVV